MRTYTVDDIVALFSEKHPPDGEAVRPRVTDLWGGRTALTLSEIIGTEDPVEDILLALCKRGDLSFTSLIWYAVICFEQMLWHFEQAHASDPRLRHALRVMRDYLADSSQENKTQVLAARDVMQQFNADLNTHEWWVLEHGSARYESDRQEKILATCIAIVTLMLSQDPWSVVKDARWVAATARSLAGVEGEGLRALQRKALEIILAEEEGQEA